MYHQPKCAQTGPHGPTVYSPPATTRSSCVAHQLGMWVQGDESFRCEVCKDKTQATKRMRLHRLPKVLLLHVKRFKYSGTSREKLTANVSFPIKARLLRRDHHAVMLPNMFQNNR